MRKTILAAMLGLSFTAALPALDLSLHGGYTSFNMSEVNRANAELIGYGGNGYSEPIQSGFVVGADLTLPAARGWLQAGLRTEYLLSNLAETKGMAYGMEVTDRAALSDLLVGLKGSTGGALSLGLGVWAGYGYATYDQRDLGHSLAQQSGLYMGSLPVAEFEGTVAYSLGQHIRLNFTGGYRWADAVYLYDDTHRPLAESGMSWWLARNYPVNVDYSGVTGQGSVSYLF
jgi:hypothetical protein